MMSKNNTQVIEIKDYIETNGEWHLRNKELQMKVPPFNRESAWKFSSEIVATLRSEDRNGTHA